ncbi:MAG: hypothetical protein J7K26_03140 [Candidatus Aenigmarchaeota archaeon]|nr:hypothetical protein [Candidatus Aenigmarchaeota archaeon]
MKNEEVRKAKERMNRIFELAKSKRPENNEFSDYIENTTHYKKSNSLEEEQYEEEWNVFDPDECNYWRC